MSTASGSLWRLYHWYYDLAIAAAARILGRSAGVRAVYLRRGAARGQIVCGLSDIDLSVIVADGSAARVRSRRHLLLRRYRLLAKVFPVFADPAQELGIYTESEFKALADWSDLWRYRLSEAQAVWRLLHGRDILSEMPRVDTPAMIRASVEELCVWWRQVMQLVAESRDLPAFVCKYGWYKMVAEAVRLYRGVMQDAWHQDRRTALADELTVAGRQDQGDLALIQSYGERPAARTSIHEDRCLSLFFRYSDRVIRERSRRLQTSRPPMRATLRFPAPEELCRGPRIEERLARLYRCFDHSGFQSSVRCRLIPQFYWGPRVLYLSHVDGLSVVALLPGPVRALLLRRLMGVMEAGTATQSLNLILQFGRGLYVLPCARHPQVIVTRDDDPVTWALVDNAFRPCGGGSQEPLVLELPRRFDRIRRERVRRLKVLMAGDDAFRFRPLEIARLLWEGVRILTWERARLEDVPSLPLTVRQIQEAARKYYPQQAGWIDEFGREYEKELTGRNSELFRYTADAVQCLRRIL